VRRLDRERLTLAESIAGAWVMAERELAATLRRPTLVVVSFVQPVLIVLLFRYVFGGAIATPGTSYVNYLTPGILVLTAIFGAILTGIGLAEDTQKGLVDRLRSLPMASSAVLVGRTLSDLARSVSTLALVLAGGFLIGFRPASRSGRSSRRWRCCSGLPTCFLDLGSDRTLATRPGDRAVGGPRLGLPADLCGSAFVPTASMPAAVETFANVMSPDRKVRAGQQPSEDHFHAPRRGRELERFPHSRCWSEAGATRLRSHGCAARSSLSRSQLLA